MVKAAASRSAVRGKQSARGKSVAERAKLVQREAASGQFVISRVRREAVKEAAQQSGLLGEKRGRIGGRVSQALVQQAKRQTGIETDSELIEFALATVALEDNFAEAFKQSRGTVDPKLKLGLSRGED